MEQTKSLLESGSETQSIAIAILAGGRGRRMGGTAKGKLEIGDEMLLDRMLTELDKLDCEKVLVAKDTSTYSDWNIRIISDILPDQAPLVGIYSALKILKTDHVLALAVDLPGIRAEVLSYLLTLRETADIVIPRIHSRWEPLCAVYGKKLVRLMENQIQKKRYKPIDLMNYSSFREVTADEIQGFVEPEMAFANLNTPDDVRFWVDRQ